LAALRTSGATAVELSALREPELAPLMRDLATLDLRQFGHVSVHAPSALHELTERELVAALMPAVEARYPIVVHADLIADMRAWAPLGGLLHIENMDKRKRTGRTASELRPLMRGLAEARLCLDLAHARQVDPSLCESVVLLDEFADRLGQIHLSELNSASRHERMSHAAVAAFQSLSRLVPANVPVILEFAAEPDELRNHLEFARKVLFPTPILVRDVG